MNDSSDDTPKCSKCQTPLPGLAPLGLCPACLVDPGIFPDDEDAAHEASMIGDELENLGTVIDRYKLLEVIGEGGFGVVYMAEQREPVRRMVALKIIKLGMDTKQVIARFESERQALALMEHQNVARVIDGGATATGRPYFVMELVRGIPIHQFCDEHQLGTRERLQLFLGVCSAIQHAHQKGIIHRDLKPSNVLVAIDDDGPTPKVIDFGIAKATAAQRLTELTVFTQFHQFLGTPAYTSPEQAQFDARDVDTRSDIYSLGVLLYTLLTGQTPFDQEELMSKGQDAVFKTIREDEPPRPSTRLNALTQAQRTTTAALRKESPNQLSSHLRGDLDKVVMKAMEKDRRRRYETANGFARDIQRYLDDEPVTAVAPNTVYRLRKWVIRNRGLALATAAVATALLVGLIVSLFQARRAEAGERAAQASELAARKSFYLADMNVAQQALESGGVDRARMILQRHIPKTGEEDLRDWEWRYFWGQANRHQFQLIADDDPNDNIQPDMVFDLALSPRGDLLASVARSGRIRLWDLETLQEVARFNVSAGVYAWIDFSPNGRFLAAGGRHWAPGEVPNPDTVIYDVDERTEVHRFSAAPAEACEARFLSDRLLCVIDSNENLWFWDLESKELRSENHSDKIRTFIATMSASPSAKRFLTSDIRSIGGIHLWNSESRQLLLSIEGREGGGHRTAISPVGDLLALFPQEHPWVEIVDGHSGERLTELRLQFPSVNGEFSPDGSLLVVTDTTGNVQLFDTESWEEITRYRHWGHQLNAIAMSADGSLIVSGGEDGTIVGWPRSAEKDILHTEGRIVTAVRYSPDGRLLAVGTSEGRLELWDSWTGARLHVIPVQAVKIKVKEPVFNDDFFAFNPDGQHLAVAHTTEDGKHSVRLLDTVTFATVRSLPHSLGVKTLEYSPDGRLLALGPRPAPPSEEDQGIIQIWNLARDKVCSEIPENWQIEALSFSPDSSLLISEGWGNKGINVWDAKTGKLVRNLKGHSDGLGLNKSILFSPNGSLLATAGYDHQVILWDRETWKPVRRLLGHTYGVMDLSFSPDGKRLASSGRDSQCRVWDVESGQEVASFKGYAVDFSPDGNTLAVGGAIDFTKENTMEGGTTVRLYRAKTLEEIEGLETSR